MIVNSFTAWPRARQCRFHVRLMYAASGTRFGCGHTCHSADRHLEFPQNCTLPVLRSFSP